MGLSEDSGDVKEEDGGKGGRASDESIDEHKFDPFPQLLVPFRIINPRPFPVGILELFEEGMIQLVDYHEDEKMHEVDRYSCCHDAEMEDLL